MSSTPESSPRVSGRLIGKRRGAGKLIAPKNPAPLADPTSAPTLLDGVAVDADADGWVLPERLGPYRLGDELARGGMGVVVRARHEQLERDVAIKLLRPEVSGDEEAQERFLREARATARLRHPNIVQIHDVVSDPEGRTYLVMDFVAGQTLKARIGRTGLEPREAARLMEGVALAVAEAHDHGILHRDLKPHNVLIDAAGQVPLLTDFGLAKVVDDKRDSRRVPAPQPLSASAELTQAGAVLGTPLYMAPEQLDPKFGDVSEATDIYALGAMLYESLTGRTPVQGDTLGEVFQGILERQPPLPSTLKDVPAELEAIALRCLEKRPRARHASARTVARELARFLQGAPVLSQPHVSRGAPPARPGRRLLLGGLAGGLGLWLWLGRGEPPPQPTPPPPVATPSPTLPELPVGGEWVPGLRRAPVPIVRGNVARLAAEGYADAMLHYGSLIVLGEVPNQGPRVGLGWMERAAAAGLPKAYVDLGGVFAEGVGGVEADPVQAEAWWRRGAEAGVGDCWLHLGGWLVSRGEADALAEGIACLRAAHERGAQGAGVPLARALALRGTPEDWAQALELLEAHAADEDPQALFELGQAHELGFLGLNPSAEEAREHYRRAHEAGHPQAGFHLGRLGDSGR